jgi:DNA-binding beta-propeller fold protein YncE
VVDLGAENPSQITIRDVIPVPPGPSRLAASYDAATGRTQVYVVAYDARRISVVDPAEHRIVSETSTNRGPHALVRDPNGEFLYVVDFLDNAVEVLDLRARTAEGAENPTRNRRLLTVGGA